MVQRKLEELYSDIHCPLIFPYPTENFLQLKLLFIQIYNKFNKYTKKHKEDYLIKRK